MSDESTEGGWRPPPPSASPPGRTRAARVAAVEAEQADLEARWERLDELLTIEGRYVALEAEVTRLREVVRAWSRVLVGRGLARPDEVLRAVQGVSGVPSREELEDLWAPWRRIGS